MKAPPARSAAGTTAGQALARDVVRDHGGHLDPTAAGAPEGGTGRLRRL
ncbi:hypothetical protein ABZ770_35825 [Streptomyces sp. NPDC006654]